MESLGRNSTSFKNRNPLGISTLTLHFYRFTIQKLSGKKVFIFGTAGYDNTKEYFEGILESVKTNVPESNTIIGSYMCQGRVSDAIQDKIKNGMPDKYEAIKDKLAEKLIYKIIKFCVINIRL